MYCMYISVYTVGAKFYPVSLHQVHHYYFNLIDPFAMQEFKHESLVTCFNSQLRDLHSLALSNNTNTFIPYVSVITQYRMHIVPKRMSQWLVDRVLI
jgi:hypothetical protein